ncbi:MAG: hypothetical protein ACI4KF_06505 [Huintestinicola sp.]
MKRIARIFEMLREYPLIMLAAAAAVFYLTDGYAEEIRAAETIGNAFVISVYGNLLGMVLISIGLIAAETRAMKKREERAYRARVRSLRKKYAAMYYDADPDKQSIYASYLSHREEEEKDIRRAG